MKVGINCKEKPSVNFLTISNRNTYDSCLIVVPESSLTGKSLGLSVFIGIVGTNDTETGMVTAPVDCLKILALKNPS